MKARRSEKSVTARCPFPKPGPDLNVPCRRREGTEKVVHKRGSMKGVSNHRNRHASAQSAQSSRSLSLMSL
jgi:hypothetical protein